MAKRHGHHLVFTVFAAFLAGLTSLPGCSRNEPPQPQSGSPAMTAPQQQTAVPATQPIPANVAQLQMGMSSQQVLQLLGSPSKVKPKGQYVEWEYWTAQGKVEIKLQADQVVGIERH